MKTVIVRKDELLDTLRINRSKHREVFEQAQKGYRIKAIKLLDAALKDAERGLEIRTYIELESPIDQTRDYDRVISMLEMSVDTKVELSENEFSQYVLDDWNWKRQFLTTNSMYMKE